MALQIIENLLSDLNSNNINYCHWKSNEHLEAAMNGDTDLDILFDKDQEQHVIEILMKNKFHLFEAVWYRRYQGIVDYIGFDKELGKIVHVHTHFSLNIGEVGIKSYHLPWEELILSNRIFDAQFNIYKSSPEVEYLLLVVRSAFKYDFVNQSSNQKIAKHFDREAFWLYERISLEEINRISSCELGKEMTDLIEKIILNRKYDNKLFASLKKLLQPYFSEHRLLSGFRVELLKTIHLFKRIGIKVRTKLKLPTKVNKRSLPGDGLIVCIMGSDGAGKSTQTKEITRELGIKVNREYIYMGSGDGKKSFFRRILQKLIAARKSSVKKKSNAEKNNVNVSKPSFEIQDLPFKNRVLIIINSLLIAYEKRRRLIRAKKAKSKGEIVICDRYPQINVLGYNDSPKMYIYLNSANYFLRLLSKYEYACYKLSENIKPDLVIKLIGDTEILHSRRPEMTLDEIVKKQNGILNLPFSNYTNIVILDIDKPIFQIKGLILDALSDQISKRNI